MDPQQQNHQPQQTFQPAPQAPTPPADPKGSPTPPPQSFIDKLKANKAGIILGSFIFVLIIGMGAYIVSPSRNTLVAPAEQVRPTGIPTITPTPTLAPIATPTTFPTPSVPAATWKTYANTTYGYSIKYPPDWTVINVGVLEPKIPSYIVFNNPSASASARNITISISTRSYSEQLTLGASGSATTVGGIIGSKQSFRDSDGNTSTVITLPRTGNLLVLRSKTNYLSVFNVMITTLTTTK